MDTPMPMSSPVHRRGFSLIATAVLAASLSACGGSAPPAEETTRNPAVGMAKIGLIVPLSGVYSSLGIDMQNGFDLYLDQHAGRLGGKDVELKVVDEGEGPQTGVPAATKLIKEDKVAAVVGIVNSATAMGVRDTFIDSKTPLIIANAGADGVTGTNGSPYIWRTSFTNGTVGASLGAEVSKQVGDGSVYLISADYSAGKEMIGGFKKAFEAAGGKVAGESYTPFGTTKDFQPYLDTIKASGAKAVFCFYAGAEAVSFVKQYAQFGLAGDLPLFGTGFVTEGGALDAEGISAEGTQTSLHYTDLIDTPKNKKFVADYQAAFNARPTVYAVQAYDAAAVLDAALARPGTADGRGIARALGEIGPIDSPRGSWGFGRKHDPVQPYYLRKVEKRGGRFVNTLVRELTRAKAPDL
ncbi:ABC transporter substrate-binding protein [Sphaerisporangium perillae]|uniref:ABC transporter substrate-binding protein n=1 Tax=Sphaerisporangium perillae TaxID=2935860 RepID=UPI00200F3906|nr:ABC transporter substrate-binding protein [Sphaerisporangium perillae]